MSKFTDSVSRVANAWLSGAETIAKAEYGHYIEPRDRAV